MSLATLVHSIGRWLRTDAWKHSVRFSEEDLLDIRAKSLRRRFGVDVIRARPGGVPFRHKGCSTECVRYIGDADATLNTRLEQSCLWEINGERIEFGSNTCVVCPDCGKRGRPMLAELEAL